MTVIMYDITESQVAFPLSPYKWAIIAFDTAGWASELLGLLNVLSWVRH